MVSVLDGAPSERQITDCLNAAGRPIPNDERRHAAPPRTDHLHDRGPQPPDHGRHQTIAAEAEEATAMTEAATAELIEAAVRQMRAERDAAVEQLVVLLADLRSDNAVLAARLDRIDAPTPLPGFVTLKQAAAACGYTCEAVRQWAATGQITADKRGGRVRVELASVMQRAGRRG
jgi:hypothetical protein